MQFVASNGQLYILLALSQLVLLFSSSCNITIPHVTHRFKTIQPSASRGLLSPSELELWNGMR